MKNWEPAESGCMARAIERTPSVWRKVIFEAVLGELTRNRVARAAHAGTVWTAALDHKAVDDAVEDQAIIEALLYEADEVVDGVRSDLRVELCL